MPRGQSPSSNKAARDAARAAQERRAGMSPGEGALVREAENSARSRGGDIRGPEGSSDSGGFAGNEPDPTRETGIGFLDAADKFLQQPQTPQDITPPTERTGTGFNPPNDELNPGLLSPIRPPEEEAPIVPGDPDDLGERGRRRRRRDDVNTSPVLRRGLLGV